MGFNDYYKCTGLDHIFNIIPEIYSCPGCGNDVGIWSDERKRICANCNSVVHNKNHEFIKEIMIQQGDEINSKLKSLTQLACRLGASDAKVIFTIDIVVDDGLAKLCKEPRCENYGQSTSCPPYVQGPSKFRELLKNFHHAIVIKIDIPLEILLSNERRDIMKLLHEIGAEIERSAIQMGYPNSKAFVGGSCKQIFCKDYIDCRVLTEGKECRNPRDSRPSMSGFGINVSKLMQVAGWTMNRNISEDGQDTTSMSTVSGLILIN